VTIEAIFLAAVGKAAPAERAAYLDAACGGDARLRADVEGLLRSHDEAGSVLEQPLFGPAPTAALLTSDEPTAAGPATLGGVIGPYRLVGVVGEGGMGTVWRAEQTQPVRRTVALKLVRPGMDSRQVLARFGAERQALALMDHPNIARVLDAGATDAGRPYFVMELVEGTPITRFCDGHRLSVRRRLELFACVCRAVQHAHQKGVIHRDLKPSNILVAEVDGRPVPKVIDFGIAKPTGRPLTDATPQTGLGAVVGTPEYMSPEQAELNNQDIDTRSDVYSLGVLLYELLTGTTPLTGKRVREVGLLEALRVVREEEPPRPSARLVELRGAEVGSQDGNPAAAARGLVPRPAPRTRHLNELDWVVMKCLEKDRARRYETADGLAADVGRHLRDEPVLACPPSAGYRLRKFVRRNRVPVLAAAVVLLALVGGVVGATWGAVVADRAREGEAGERVRAEEALRREAERADGEERARRDTGVERDRAVEAEADTRAFAEFLARYVLAANRPEGVQEGIGVNVRLTEALEAAEPHIEEVFRGRPKAEALARHEVGVTWRNLGRYADAERNLRRAVELRTAALGPDAEDTLRSLNSLAVALVSAGRYDEAEPLFLKVIPVETARLGADHRATLMTRLNLAMLYKDRREYARAEPLLLEVARAQTALLGADDPDTLLSKSGLGGLYRDRGQYDRAEPLVREVLSGRAARLGPDHPATLRAKHNLAVLYQTQKRFGEAEALFREVLPARVAKLGATHTEALTTKSCLAVVYRDLRKFAEAEPLFVEVLQGFTAGLGADHPDTLMAMNNLAALYWSTRRLEKSVPLFEETLRCRVRALGQSHPDAVVTALNLAVNYLDARRPREAVALLDEWLPRDASEPGSPPRRFALRTGATVYEAAGQFAKAEPLRRESTDFWKQKAGAGSLQHAGEWAALANNLLGQRRYADAESFLRAGLPPWESRSPDEWGVFYARSMLGAALLGQEKYADAEPLLLRGYEGVKRREATIPEPFRKRRLTESLERLVRLYEAWDKPDEAARWRKALEAHGPAGPKADKPKDE